MMAKTDTEYGAELEALDLEIAGLEEQVGETSLDGGDTSALAARVEKLASRRRVLIAERAAARRRAAEAERLAVQDQVDRLAAEYRVVGAEHLRRLAAWKKADAAAAKALAALNAEDQGGGATTKVRMRTIYGRVTELDVTRAVGLPVLPGPLNDGGDLSPAALLALAKEWEAIRA